jgi:acyl-CoA thioesterase I
MRSAIRHVLSLFMLLLSQALAASPGPGQSILVLGDSLSAAYGITEEESWVALMRDRLTAEGYGYHVLNASISGDTTSGGLRRLVRALEQHAPALVIIELGGNDGLRGTPLRTIRQNLAEMIERSLNAGARVVLAGMMIPPNLGPYADAFARIYPELAAEYDVALIGFFLDGIALDRSLMQPDGIHPTAEAQPLVLKNVWPVLEPELRRLAKSPARQAQGGAGGEIGAEAVPASP